MNIEPATPTSKNPPEQFAGDVWLARTTNRQFDGDQDLEVARKRRST